MIELMSCVVCVAGGVGVLMCYWRVEELLFTCVSGCVDVLTCGVLRCVDVLMCC
jgi:hypothetical protein